MLTNALPAPTTSLFDRNLISNNGKMKSIKGGEENNAGRGEWSRSTTQHRRLHPKVLQIKRAARHNKLPPGAPTTSTSGEAMKPIAHSLHAAVDRRWLLPLAVGSALSLLLLVALTTFPSPSAPSSTSALFVEHKLAPSPPSPSASLPRIAFLISGSAGDASALRRVLLALYHPRNRYILHLDAEAPDSDRSNLAADLASHPAIAAAANVRVVERANLVTYRGPTMVANTLHAAAAFLWGDGASHWDWFINLSASDYPLVTQDGKKTVPPFPFLLHPTHRFYNFQNLSVQI